MDWDLALWMSPIFLFLVVLLVAVCRDHYLAEKESEEHSEKLRRKREECRPFHWEKGRLCKDEIYRMSSADIAILEYYSWYIKDELDGDTVADVRPREDGTLSLHFYFMKDDPESEVQAYYRKSFEEKFPEFDTPNSELADAVKRSQDAKQQYDVDRQLKEFADRQAAYAAAPKCPLCRSTQIAPISMAKRVVSTEFLGWASPTIGKSYECKTCGYRW